jgi:ABC-type nitrate/sulfonate/bicarbonate transport system ATPase subunit
MIMVSHSIDEAIELSDRIVVFEMGRIRTELAISLSHPRDVKSAGFIAQRQVIEKAGLLHARDHPESRRGLAG